MTRARQLVAQHTDRLRAAGGKRTSVELDADACADLEWLRVLAGSTSISATVAAALRVARLTLTPKGSK